MTEKRFTTNGYKIYDTFHDGIHWLVNQVEANEIVDKMNNLDSKARERSKALSKLQKENEQLRKENDMLSCELSVSANKEISRNCRIVELEEENKQLKSTIAQLIEQNRKNNDLLLSDIRILEKALWCSGCENDYGRLKELRKEFME